MEFFKPYKDNLGYLEITHDRVEFMVRSWDKSEIRDYIRERGLISVLETKDVGYKTIVIGEINPCFLIDE